MEQKNQNNDSNMMRQDQAERSKTQLQSAMQRTSPKPATTGQRSLGEPHARQMHHINAANQAQNKYQQSYQQGAGLSRMSPGTSSPHHQLRQLQQMQLNQGIKRKTTSPQPMNIDLIKQNEQKKTKIDMNKYLQQSALNMSRLQAQAQAQNQGNLGVMNNMVVSMPMNIGGLNMNQPFQGVLGNPFLNIYGLQAMQQQAQNQLNKENEAQKERHDMLLSQQKPVERNAEIQKEQPAERDSKKQKVSEALHYLADVKKKFKGNVRVYCLFLEIMKKFKSNKVDTPGVLKEVINLFAAQEELITGFNKFLPTGFRVSLGKFENSPARCVRVYLPTNEYITLDLDNLNFDEFDEKMKRVNAKISADILYYNANTSAAKKHRSSDIIPGARPEDVNRTGVANNLLHAAQYNNHVDLATMNQLGGGVASLQAISQGNPLNISFGLSNLAQLNTAMGQGGLNTQQPATGLNFGAQELDKSKQKANGKSEFSEAIHYVSKIKRRFAHDSAAYRSFLDILHTYQKDQGTIKKVLQKVAKLFEGHNDLLKEFCFFLPDESRNKAKKIVEEILRRKDAESGIDKVDKFEDKYGERMLWQRLKQKFRDTKYYTQFLGTLELFMKALITKNEFLGLTTNLLKKASNPVDADLEQPLDAASKNLLELLNSFLCSNNIVESPVLSAFYALPMSDMDFATSFRPTPSYRQLPDAYLRYSDPNIEEKGHEKVRYKLNACSGRTRFCNSVLNDKYVSVSTGSEDSSNKHFRKNIYEEALFRCEDERHAFDMALEWHRKTMLHLETLNKELNKFNTTINAVKEEIKAEVPKGAMKFRLGARSLSVLHIKAIARVYGSYADEVLELLRLTPEITLPVVLKRMKEQEVVLTQKKIELNVGWAKIHEINFPKSLDHRSFYFKQTDRKDVGTKTLLGQIKAIYKGNTEDLKGHKSSFVRFAGKGDEAVGEKVLNEGDAESKTHLELLFDDIMVHRECLSIVVFMLRKVEVSSRSPTKVQYLNTAKMLTFIVNVLIPFFGLKLEDFKAEQGDSAEADLLLTKKAKELLRTAKLKQQAARGEEKIEEEVELAALFDNFKSIKGKTSFDGTDVKTFYGASSLFLFFRLYNILYERLHRAKIASEKAAAKQRRETVSETGLVSAEERYTRIVDSLHSLVSGDIDSAEFEDICRDVLQSGSYFLFTLEKVLSLLDKHMENGLLNEDKMKGLFKKLTDFSILYEQSADPLSDITVGQLNDKLVQVYRHSYQALMNQVDGLCYKIVLVPGNKKSEDNMEQEGDSVWQSLPKIEVTLTKKFPTVDVLLEGEGEVIGQPHIMLPFEVAFNDPTFRFKWLLENRHEYRANMPVENSVEGTNYFAYPILQPHLLKLREDQLTDLQKLGSIYAQRRKNEQEEGIFKFGAKTEWWYFGNYEDCRSEKRELSATTENGEDLEESDNVDDDDSSRLNEMEVEKE